MIFSFLNASTEGDVFTLIQKIMTDTEYLSVLQQSSDPQAQSREENLGELLNVAKDFTGAAGRRTSGIFGKGRSCK